MKILKKEVLLLMALVLFTITAKGEDCSPVDLRNSSVFEQVGIYNQKDTGICYSMADANLVNYWLISNNYRFKAHPLEFIALNPSQNIEGGNAAIRNALRNQSLCSAIAIDRFFRVHLGTYKFVDFISLFLKSGKIGVSEYRLMQRLVRDEERRLARDRNIPRHLLSGTGLGRDNIRAHLRVYGRYGNGNYIRMAKRFLYELRGKKNCPQCIDNKVSEFQDLLVEIGRWIFNEIKKPEQNNNKVIKKIYQKICDNNSLSLPIPNLMGAVVGRSSYSKAVESQNAILSQMDRVLTKNNPQPYKLGICANIFKNPNYQYISKNIFGLLKTDRECRGHAIVVIARRASRKDSNSCEYLIRNSWGRSRLMFYDLSYDTEPAGVWLSRKQIRNSLLDGYGLE